MSWIEDFFLFFSKTDLKVIRICTRETQMTQVAIGCMVLITGIFAFISGFFAIHSSFNVTLLAVLIAFLYASAIILFDREIASSIEKKTILLRIPFAILIGLVISFPIELELLSGRIDAQIKMIVDTRNKDVKEEIQNIDKAFEGRKAVIAKQIANYQKELEYKSAQQKKEYDGTGYSKTKGRGPNYETFEGEIASLKGNLDAAQAEYKDYRPIESDIKKKDALNEQVKEEYRKATDFLSKMEALEQITAQSSSAMVMTWVLRIFFVLLELFPVLLKYFMKYNEYQAYLACRLEMNKQKCHAYTNVALDIIANNPLAAVTMTDFTDAMASAIEDSETNPAQVRVAPPSGSSMIPGFTQTAQQASAQGQQQGIGGVPGQPTSGSTSGTP